MKYLAKNDRSSPENETKGMGWEFFNKIGGFVAEGREYAILLQDDNRPPAPWVNVIANEKFGFLVSPGSNSSSLSGIYSVGNTSQKLS